MEKAEKPLLVAELNAVFKTSNLVVVARQNGLTVAEVNALRAKMRAAGASFKITKNTLTRLALKDTQFEGLTPLFKGVTTIAASKDPIAAAKAAAGFANDNKKFEILGGNLNGKALSAKDVQALATLPSLDELRGKIIGLLQAPASKMARVIAAPPAQLARVINAYATKGQ